MSLNDGSLLWRRMRITLLTGTHDIDTGLTQLNKSFEADSLGEPFLGVGGTASPGPGVGAPSRIQVLPQAPLIEWANVTIEEPYFNTTTHTVHVAFVNSGQSTLHLNAFFWDPHTVVGPGEADTYSAPD